MRRISPAPAWSPWLDTYAYLSSTARAGWRGQRAGRELGAGAALGDADQLAGDAVDGVGEGDDAHAVRAGHERLAQPGTDDRVRVKFENQDDPAFYDPSIADVWAYALP